MIRNYTLAAATTDVCTSAAAQKLALFNMMFYNTSASAVTLEVHLVPKGVTKSAATQVAYWEVPPKDWAEWTSDAKLMLEDGDKVAVVAGTGAVINAFVNYMVVPL